MSQVFETFRMYIPLEASHLRLMVFQNILRLLPTSVAPSNEILLIRTLEPGFDLHEE